MTSFQFWIPALFSVLSASLVLSENECSYNTRSAVQMLPHSEDCAKYITCAGQIKIVQSCPEGSVWNAWEKTCSSNSATVKCRKKRRAVKRSILGTRAASNSEIEASISCVDKSGQCPAVFDPTHLVLKPHETCEKYYLCISFLPVVLSCPVNLQFNRESCQCDFPANANCGETTDAPPTETDPTITPTETDSPPTETDPTITPTETDAPPTETDPTVTPTETDAPPTETDPTVTPTETDAPPTETDPTVTPTETDAPPTETDPTITPTETDPTVTPTETDPTVTPTETDAPPTHSGSTTTPTSTPSTELPTTSTEKLPTTTTTTPTITTSTTPAPTTVTPKPPITEQILVAVGKAINVVDSLMDIFFNYMN